MVADSAVAALSGGMAAILIKHNSITISVQFALECFVAEIFILQNCARRETRNKIELDSSPLTISELSVSRKCVDPELLHVTSSLWSQTRTIKKIKKCFSRSNTQLASCLLSSLEPSTSSSFNNRKKKQFEVLGMMWARSRRASRRNWCN